MKNNGLPEDQVAILRKHYAYDPVAGVLVPLKADCCKSLRPFRASVGGKAQKNGYKYISVGSHRIGESRMRLLYHRVVWAVVHGPIIPGMEVDHINGDRTDNRVENLRIVTRSGNQQNQRAAQVDSQTGLLGASPEGRTGRYVATIRHLGKKIHIGTFTTAEEAHEAYLETKRRVHSACSI